MGIEGGPAGAGIRGHESGGVETGAVAGPEGVATGDGGIGEGEVMGAGFAGDGDAFGAGVAEEIDALAGADVLAVDGGAGEAGEEDVAGDDGVFADGGPTAQAEDSAPVAFVDDAFIDQAVVLAMIEDGEVEHAGVFHGAAHDLGALDAMAVIGDGDHAGAVEGADGGEFLAGDALGDGTGDEDTDGGILSSGFPDQTDGGGMVDGGLGIGHADHGGEPATGSAAGAGGDILLGGLAGFTEVDVKIDEAGGDDEAVQVHDGDGTGFGVVAEVGGQGGDAPVAEENIAGGIEILARIEEAPAAEQQIGHGRQPIGG